MTTEEYLKESYLQLKAAAAEIKRLRYNNEIMSARLTMFDNVMTILHTKPSYTGIGMSEDIVYDIEKLTTEIETNSSITNKKQ